MKKFSKHWKSSKKPKKQRKYLAKAPIHLRRKLIKITLSKDLRKKHEKRNISPRKGDSVKIIKGKFKGKQGKIIKINLKKIKIYVENIQVKKQEGSKVNVPLKPSSLEIIELNLEDKKRLKKLKEINEKHSKEKTKEIKK